MTARAFLERFAQHQAEYDLNRRRWCNQLKSIGVKAAHPDDGWHNHKEREFMLCYPDFNDGVQVGDLVALGAPDEYRVVTVRRIKNGMLSGPYYQY